MEQATQVHYFQFAEWIAERYNFIGGDHCQWCAKQYSPTDKDRYQTTGELWSYWWDNVADLVEIEDADNAPEPIQGGEFKKCCAEHIRAIYVDNGTQIWGNTACPVCNQYIGFSPSSNDEVDDFLEGFGLEPMFKNKQAT